MTREPFVKDPILGEIVANLPDGYRIVCTRCALRNGYHHSSCGHPVARKIRNTVDFQRKGR